MTEAAHQLIVRQLSPTAMDPCPTCAKVFFQPENEVVPVTSVELDDDELPDSAKAGCEWCRVQWEEILSEYHSLNLHSPEVKRFRISVSIHWLLGGVDKPADRWLPFIITAYDSESDEKIKVYCSAVPIEFAPGRSLP